MDKFTQITRQPEYAHLLLNHLPIVGLATAMLFLAGAIWLRHRPTTIFALVVTGCFALSAFFVMQTGEAAFNRILASNPADATADALLKTHAEVAHGWQAIFYVTGGAALLAAGLTGGNEVALRLAAILVLALGLVCVFAGAQIAEAGGRIKHRELRGAGTPPAGGLNY